MSEINNWQPWSLKLDLPQGLYWWRLPEAEYGGVVCQPEFVHEITSMRNGVADKNFNLPAFAHWTGWQHVVPSGLEVRVPQEGETLEKSKIHIPGFSVLDCPFCGSPASINSKDRDSGARLYDYPLRPNVFWVGCTKCWATTFEYCELQKPVDLWNERKDGA